MPDHPPDRLPDRLPDQMPDPTSTPTAGIPARVPAHREPGDPDGEPRLTPGAHRMRAKVRQLEAARARLAQLTERRAVAPRAVISQRHL